MTAEKPDAAVALLNEWADAACVRFVSRSYSQQTTDTVCRDDLLQLVRAAMAQAPEPVAAQCRFPGVAWSQCDVEHARMVMANPSEWPKYQVRLLCEWYSAEQMRAEFEAGRLAERNRCRYPDCIENDDERCPRWLTGECEGPNAAHQRNPAARAEQTKD